MTQLTKFVFFFFFVEYIPVDGRKHQNISGACYMMLRYTLVPKCCAAVVINTVRGRVLYFLLHDLHILWFGDPCGK